MVTVDSFEFTLAMVHVRVDNSINILFIVCFYFIVLQADPPRLCSRNKVK